MNTQHQMASIKNLHNVPDNYYSDKARQERSDYLAQCIKSMKFFIIQAVQVYFRQFKDHA